MYHIVKVSFKKKNKQFMHKDLHNEDIQIVSIRIKKKTFPSPQLISIAKCNHIISICISNLPFEVREGPSAFLSGSMSWAAHL